MISYTTTLTNLPPDALAPFFSDWSRPPTLDRRARILTGSDHAILAYDNTQLVGIITAITDHAQWAFIPFLEVLPTHRNRGIGTQLVRHMLDTLKNYPCIDLSCDPELQPFYAKLGMIRSHGMMLRTAN